MKKALAALAVVAPAVLAASGAHAFTFENSPGPSGSGGSSLAEPGEQVRSGGASTTTTGREGASGNGLQFSVRPGSAFSNRPNTAPPPWMADPLYLDKSGAQ